MKTWTKPLILNLDKAVITSGNPAATLAYEAYVNLGSGTGYPCLTTNATCANGAVRNVFTTTSFYFNASGVANSNIAACNQTNGMTAQIGAICS